MGVTESLVIVAMVAINGVFAAFEIALATVSKARLQSLAQQDRPGAKAALGLKNRMEASLATVQVGITLVGAIAAATGGAAAEESIIPFLRAHFGLSRPLANVCGIALVVVPLTIFSLVVGELVPKVFAIRNKEAVCLRLSPWVRWFAYSVWPLVRVCEWLVLAIMNQIERALRGRHSGAAVDSMELHELGDQAATARAMRLIGEREEAIIVSAAWLARRPIREIMLPAADMNLLDIDASLAESLIAAHLDMHTRYPVSERRDDPQAIVGYVNFKDIVALMRLSQDRPLSLRNIVRAMPSLNEDQPIAASLEGLIREHSHIALVRDRAGRVAGMVTLEDIMEELVGDIQDEYDRLPVHVIASGQAWIVGGGASLGRLKEVTGLDLLLAAPAGDARNLSEWIIHHLGARPRGGDLIESGSVRALVRKVRRQKVLEVQLSRRGDKSPA